MQTYNMSTSIALFTVNCYCRVYIFNYLHHFMDKQLKEEADQYHRIVIKCRREFRCQLFTHLPSDYAVWSNQHSKFDWSILEGTKNEALWHNGRKKFLIAIWEGEIIKTQLNQTNKKPKHINLLDLFLRELKERERSNSEAEQQRLKAGKLQLAWLTTT